MTQSGWAIATIANIGSVTYVPTIPGQRGSMIPEEEFTGKSANASNVKSLTHLLIGAYGLHTLMQE